MKKKASNFEFGHLGIRAIRCIILFFVFINFPLVGLCTQIVYAQIGSSAFTKDYRYDAQHRITGTIDPDPDGVGGIGYAASRYTLDLAGRPIKIEVGELSAWQSDAVPPSNWGNAPSELSAFTIFTTTEISYDVLGRKIRELKRTQQSGEIYFLEQYSYDAVGRLQCTAVRMNPIVYGSLPASACTLGSEGSNGPDRIRRNVYDAAGQLVQVREAVGTPLEIAYATYGYTPNGKQEYVIDANGNRAQMVYDGFDRQVKWIFPGSTVPAGYNPATPATALATAGSINASDYEQYGYDANGNRTSFRKRDGSTLTFQYDALNRMTAKIVPERSDLPLTHTRDVYFGYDLRGLQTYARFDSAAGEGITNFWDGFGRLASSTQTMDGVSRTLTYQYDADGNRTRITWPDGNFVTYNYDGLDRPSTILRSGSVAIASYTYDSAGRRSGFQGGINTSYGYDGIGRLVTLTNNLPAATWNNQFGFSYNPADQIVSLYKSNALFAFSGTYNVNRNYSVNGLNQYSQAGAVAFSYDLNGNLKSDNANTFTYDIENRLVAAAGARTASMRYDPLGRLYEIGSTRFLYDGDAIAAEYDLAGNTLRRYVHGADSASDDPIAWYEGAGFSGANERLMRPDWQGSIALVTDTTGAGVIGVNRYDEYGIPQSGNIGRFQYTGQAWLAELGMYYYKARIYSPTLGRFLQTDPIGYKDQVNLYAYVANDPVNLKDVTGERITVVMHQVTVGPYQSGSYHMKIVVTPDDQKTFRNDERFRNRQNGVAFATIGAGPDTWKNVAGPLVSGVNRETDVAKVKSGESFTIAELKPGKGDTENNLINRLFAVAGSYKNNLDYSLNPSAKGRDYNSNSFVQGVLGAVGAKVTTPAGVSLPGADKPVPRTDLCTPGKDGCAR